MEPLPYAGIPTETVMRIIEAADTLYEEVDRKAFPSVDAVRRRARVNMNDASAAMRTWRREKTKLAAPLNESVPAPVQDACHTLLETMWKAATELANANLRAAQQGWEVERAEAESCRLQLAAAFDQQSTELAEAQHLLGTLQAELSSHRIRLEEAAQTYDSVTKSLRDAEARADLAKARTAEIERRAADLKTELDASHSHAREERMEAQRRIAAAEHALSERDEAARELQQAYAASREELGHLRGHLEALTGHVRKSK